jgi:SAM-dependent methyltransferase
MTDQQDSPAPAEAEQAAAGNPVLSLDFYDAEMRRHNEHFRAAADVRPDERVLDIGCGTGQTTREAARSAVNGSALGVDISPRMLERARELTDAEGPPNASYQLGDAQTHPFPAAGFDLGISRFGTMFFADPVAAFTNIGRALHPEGRLMIMAWQAPGRNEWFTATLQALAAETAPVTAPPDAPDPFSLADPAGTRELLAAVGFAEIGFSDVHEPVYYGLDGAAAYDVILSLRFANDLLAAQDAAGKQRALGRLRASLAERDTGSGVFFDSRAWIITARRR